VASAIQNIERLWHDASFVSKHEGERRAHLRKGSEKQWVVRFPLLDGISRSAAAPLPCEAIKLAQQIAAEFAEEQQSDGETLGQRNGRLDHRVASCGNRRLAPPQSASLKGDPTHALPRAFDEQGVLVPQVVARISPRQAEQAKLLFANRLANKARRHAYCRIIARPKDCLKNSAHKFFKRQPCRLRYCPKCGPLCFSELFAKHVRLRSVVEDLLRPRPGDRRRRVLARIDITSRKLGMPTQDELIRRLSEKLGRRPTRNEVRQFTRQMGRMPTRGEAILFNQLVRKFWRAAERRFGISRQDYGVLWCDEFGSGNSNLHAHGIYCGPSIPQTKEGKELSRLWAEICADTAFEGSAFVSIKFAKSFESALSHALKYPSKFFDASPSRLVALEVAFDHVRRVHAMTRFYNPRIEREPGEDDRPEVESCPLCRGSLGEPRAGWFYVDDLQREGRLDLEEARIGANRERVLSQGIRSP